MSTRTRLTLIFIAVLVCFVVSHMVVISHLNSIREMMMEKGAVSESVVPPIPEPEATTARLERGLSSAMWLDSTGAILGVAIIIGLWVWTRFRISTPLLQISRAMESLIKGRETVAIPKYPNARDEIGTLINAASKFRGALICGQEFADLAEQKRVRLQAAVASMPIGLSMFDDCERLIICNDALRHIYRLPADSCRPGSLFADIFHLCEVFRNSSHDFFQDYQNAVAESAASRRSVTGLVELPEGRTISVTVQALEGGGWVSIHEDITERRRSEERIAHMARYDALTDLPNRVLFREQIEEAFKHLRASESVAMIYLDLDRFKDVNDSLGHPVGDALLRQVADRLLKCVEGRGTAARFGGDEFAVLQTGVTDPRSVIALAQEVLDAISAAYDVDGNGILIGACAGISLGPADGDRPDLLIRNSDLALYSAKAESRGTFRFFNQQMNDRLQKRRMLEEELRAALDGEQFELHYQPVIDIGCNEVTGFEALLRWRHPVRGVVLPGEFIALAEESGLIVRLGAWVLRQACCDAMSWPESVTIAVNLSPSQFKNPNLLQDVIRALAVSRLPASRLELEITEGVLLANTEATLSLLNTLRSFGIRIAMDDFGVGYSSLSYLRKFPFDRIKIDGSFIQSMAEDASSMAIIRAVRGLSGDLSIAVTAEGVETDEQVEQLREEGIGAIQGNVFSGPRPFAETVELVSSFHWNVSAA
ncbi:MAG: EAL domain-containing protein [Alphaproteobacteria bacterium]|nr:EAL domain-containing protein [Alphaproteobacteria bacterium]